MTIDSQNLPHPQPEGKIEIEGAFGASDVTHGAELPPAGQLEERPGRPELGGALEALSGEVLKKRSLEVSSTSFITIISIILGVALALLAQNTFPAPSLLTGVQSACLLLLFVCTFYHYVSMSILLRWAPSFVDCSVPFVIFSLEIPPSYFLGQVAAWNGWLAVLFIFAAMGVYSTIKYSPLSHFGGDRHAQGMLHRLIREVTCILVLGAFMLGALSLLTHLFPQGETWWGFVGCFTEFATLAMIVARMEARSSGLYGYYGVNRPPFN